MKHITLITLAKNSLFATGLFLLLVIVNVPMAAQASAITPEKVLELVNTDRVSIGLPALTVNEQLTQAAQAKVKDMAEKNYFAHTSPDGKTPWNFIDEAGYSYHYAGENLAIRFTNTEDEHAAWMASPTHRANILSNKYLETGIAVWMTEQNGQKVLIVVEEFGTKPKVAIPAPPASSVLPGEVAASTVEKTPVEAIQQPVFVVPSVLAKIFHRMAVWTTEQLLIVFGLGMSEVIAVLYTIHLIRRKRDAVTSIPINF